MQLKIDISGGTWLCKALLVVLADNGLNSLDSQNWVLTVASLGTRKPLDKYPSWPLPPLYLLSLPFRSLPIWPHLPARSHSSLPPLPLFPSIG